MVCRPSAVVATLGAKKRRGDGLNFGYYTSIAPDAINDTVFASFSATWFVNGLAVLARLTLYQLHCSIEVGVKLALTFSMQGSCVPGPAEGP